MSDHDFWQRVRHGAEKLGVQHMVRNWKHRGRVSRNWVIPIYQVLQGTDEEIPLSQFNNTNS